MSIFIKYPFMKILSLSLILFAVLVSCNPAKRLNTAVVEKKEKPVNVQFPQQHIVTPQNINFVYDYDQLYTPQQEQKLDSLLRVFEKSNVIAIKLVTLNRAAMQTADFDANNALLYKEWDKVHGGSGKVMVITIMKDEQKTKADYGPFVSKLLSEAELATIIENARPVMERGDFFGGTWQGLNQLMDRIRKNIGF